MRVTAWALVAAGTAAPLARRRLRLRPGRALAMAALAPPSAYVAMRPSRRRDLAVILLNMWAYTAAYKLPHADPDQQAARTHIEYPVTVDRWLGLGATPTARLQRTFAAAGEVNRFERALVWCHWTWFLVPHASVGYVLARRPERFYSAAARMYAVFDVGAVFYWAIPTAPPWWAATHGARADAAPRREPIRRMMIEYGQSFWGERWNALYDLLGGNPLAAMPSLHFATSLMAAHLLSEVDPVAGTVGWVYAGMLGLALVYLGEHYLIDLIAGAALTEAVRKAAPGAGRGLAPVAAGLRALAYRAAG
jgi:PAP2 superfamily